LSAYFMSKSVFDQQGCRALTFALARLSCYIFLNFCQVNVVNGGDNNVFIGFVCLCVCVSVLSRSQFLTDFDEI